MNTPEHYERNLDRALQDPLPVPQRSETLSAFAVHRDPSLPSAGAAGAPSDHSQQTVAWIRPSELPTIVGAPWIRRGIDLQTELNRRARHSPRIATRAGQRISRAATARPEPATPTATSVEELEL